METMKFKFICQIISIIWTLVSAVGDPTGVSGISLVIQCISLVGFLLDWYGSRKTSKSQDIETKDEKQTAEEP